MTSHAAAIRTALADNGLASVPDDLVDAMVMHAQRMKNAAARARRKRHPKYDPAIAPKKPHGWNAEDRAAARSHAGALLSYASRKPRNPETPRLRRQQLLALLDRLSVMLMLKATRPVRGG